MKIVFTFVLIIASLSSIRTNDVKPDLCEMKSQASEVLSAFKSSSGREAVQRFLVELQSQLAAESQALLEKETHEKWNDLKKLEDDETESEHMRELGKLLYENDAEGQGFLYNLCGLTPSVKSSMTKLRRENQALVKGLFETLRERVNEQLPAVFETVKNSHAKLVDELIRLEPEGFKGLSRMFGSSL